KNGQGAIIHYSNLIVNGEDIVVGQQYKIFSNQKIIDDCKIINYGTERECAETIYLLDQISEQYAISENIPAAFNIEEIEALYKEKIRKLIEQNKILSSKIDFYKKKADNYDVLVSIIKAQEKN
ncbi:MAG: hypothetical protein MHMPM18_003283, partial [Marteilia pararefringens]